MAGFALEAWSRADVIAHRDVLGDVYRAAFKIESDDRVDQFISNSLVRHTDYAEYQCVVALNSRREIIGFVYGYRSEPGRWWHDTVATVIQTGGFGWYLDSAFEFVEFAVTPMAQGAGVGSAMHDRILRSTSADTALLSTDGGDNPAHAMYRRRGWIDLVQNFQYPGGGRSSVLMGLDLQAWRVGKDGTS